MRRLITICLAAVLFTTGSAWAAYSGGSGIAGDPYKIADSNDWQQLMNTSDDWNKYFVLTADIDLMGVNLTPVGYDGEFTGVFDGSDHVIRHAVINLPHNFDVGLFGDVDSAGQIRNLGVVDVNVTGRDYVGGLVGFNYGGTVTNCYVTGFVSGYTLVGGLIGENIAMLPVGGGVVTSCYASCSVTGAWNIGGLAGENFLGTMTSCYATGSVSGNYNVGGLVGYNYENSVVTSCYATGSVNGWSYVGGLVGLNEWGCDVTSCYATGSVSGGSTVGGLVGQNVGGNVTTCYATGPVISRLSGAGGLVGDNNGGNVTSCYATGPVTAEEYVGGLVGGNGGNVTFCYATGLITGTGDYVGGLIGGNSNTVTSSFWDINTSAQSTSNGGTGKTTLEMKKPSTFTDADWDFVETWGIAENQTYPFLRTESAADLNNDKKVDFADFAIFAQHWLEGVNP